MIGDARIAEGLRRQRRVRAALLAEGAAHVGWKAGFGAAASRQVLGIDLPLIGFLTDRTVLPSEPAEGVTVGIGTWTRPIAEAEIAVRMARDVPADADPEQVLAAVGWIGPAIELADIDLVPAPDAVADILEGDIFHRRVLFGPSRATPAGWPVDAAPRAGIRHRPVDGPPSDLEVVDVEDLPGSTSEVLLTCAAAADAVGPGLRAGDLVILGSVMPPVPLSPGDRFSYRLDGAPELVVDLVA